jgi:hypothetical protein
MYSILLISTRHDDPGKCNSNKLYQILEKVNHNIEEIPPRRYYISTKKYLLQNILDS